MLHFTDNELWFECYNGFTCECGGLLKGDATEEEEDHCHPTDLPCKLNLLGLLQNSKTIEELQEIWERLIQEYCWKVRNLTHRSDVFPALQGLAKVMPPIMGDYVAGLWTATLSTSLSWVAWINASEHVKLPVWRAPSWSWASSESSIMWRPVPYKYARRRQSFVTIIDVNVTPNGSDPTGELTAGTIVLRGLCLQASIQYCGPEKFPKWDSPLVKFDRGAPNLLYRPTRYSTFNWDYDITLPGKFCLPDGSPVTVMKLDEVSSEFSPGKWYRQRHWLILKQVGEEDGIFERIGLFYVEENEWPDMIDIVDELYEQHAETRDLIVV